MKSSRMEGYNEGVQIFVKAKPKSKKPYIKQADPTHFVVAVLEVPTDGKANHAICVALGKYLGIKRSDVILVSGEKSREKVFSISLSPEELMGFIA